MSKRPMISYDAPADAVAIRFASAPKGKAPTTRELAPNIRADFLGARLLGLEILEASSMLSTEALAGLTPPVELLTIREAAKASKREPTTLRSAIAAKRLLATKKGRDWQIARHDLLTYLEGLAPAGRPTNNERAPMRERRAPSTDE
jgi:hypothetical protein